jgi:hypothetical protein
MKFHLIQPGMIGRRTDIEKGTAGQIASTLMLTSGPRPL